MTVHQGVGCRQRKAWEPRQWGVGRDQNPSFMLPFDLGYTLDCSVGSGRPTRGSLAGSTGQAGVFQSKRHSYSCACLSPPPERSACHFSTADFLV